jgi:3-hydroxyacyl-CoA dehydrogenase/3-hydroxy-2-methylbutyryl-CoA dehydrogenase
MDIARTVAVITGGASGLGEATAAAFVAKGGKVVLFDLNETLGASVTRKLGDAALFRPVNVIDEASVSAGISEALDRFGAIHVCVNCAGIGNAIKTYGKNGVFPLADFDKVIQVNLIGSFNVLRLAAQQMAKNEPDADGDRGVIINTASVAAYEGQIGQAAYSASKGGIVGLTLPVARDLASYAIRVNTIVPGLIDTPLLGALPQEVRTALGQQVLYPKRLGRSAEIAHLAVAIVENSYINGECIRVDGGIRMQPR